MFPTVITSTNYSLRSSLRPILLVATYCLMSLQSVSGQAIPQETLTALKAATVYVRVDMGPLAGTGSGFLIGKEGKYAFLVTNEHVVKQRGRRERTVEVDFFSGTKKRRIFRAKVLSEDASRDLAVLRIENHEELPEPIALDSSTEIRETQGVFILGFPFGDALATNRLGPNVTIGKGTISSLRTDDYGDVEHVQVDGDINPGNSGGPIVFSDGSLMGVSVATVVGTQIGIGIPGPSVLNMLDGRVGAMGISQKSQRPQLTTCRLRAKLIDPMQKIEEVSFFYVKADKITKEDFEPNEDGQFSQISPDMKQVPMVIDRQTATANEDFSGEYGEKFHIVHQIRFKNGKGETHFTSPGHYLIRIAKRPGRKGPDPAIAKELRPKSGSKEVAEESRKDGRLGKSAPEDKEIAKEEKPIRKREGGWLGGRSNDEGSDESLSKSFDIAPKESGRELAGIPFQCLAAECRKLDLDASKVVSNIVWDKKHEHFFVLGTKGVLRKISFPDLVEVTTIDFESRCSWMAMSSEGLCVLNNGLQDLVLLDPETLEPISKYPSGDTTHFTTCPETSNAYLGTHGRLVQMDLTDGEKVKAYVGDNFPNTNSSDHTFDDPTLSPDGKFLICNSRGHLSKYLVKEDRLIWDQRGPRLGSNSRRILISPDSRYVAMPCGGGNGKGYSTHIYSIDDLEDRVLVAEGGAYPTALAFDQAAGQIYGQNHQHELIVFSGKGRINKSYDIIKRSGNTVKLSVHPDGHKVVILTPPSIVVIDLPQD